MDNIGKLNQRVVLSRITGQSRDAAGSVIPVRTSHEMWAAVEFKEVGSDERFLADQTTPVTAVKFTVRNNPEISISARDKIIYRGRNYEIQSVLEADPKRSYWTLETVEAGETPNV